MIERANGTDAADRRRADDRARRADQASARADRAARDEFMRGLAPTSTEAVDDAPVAAKVDAPEAAPKQESPTAAGEADAGSGGDGERSAAEDGAGGPAEAAPEEAEAGIRRPGVRASIGANDRLLRMARRTVVSPVPPPDVTVGSIGASVGEEPNRRRRTEKKSEAAPAALPVVTASAPESAFAPAGPSAPPRVDPHVVAQLIEFVRLREGRNGLAKLRLALAATVLGGARLDVTALGDRRISLRVRGGDRSIGDAELESLVDALEARGLRVEEAKRASP